MCDRSISVDGKYDDSYARSYMSYQFPNMTSAVNVTAGYLNENFTSRFYRGPYAHAVSDFIGYDCGMSLCPKGDNPLTDGHNEIQRLYCNATNGYFHLTFRENMTLAIYPNDTTSDLEFKLEQIYT